MKKNKNIINTGVIGLGVGMRHADIYKRNKKCKLVFLCDLRKKFNAISKIKYKCDFSTNAQKVLFNDDINLVSIASFDNYHGKQIISSIKNQKHIFVEKPLCQTHKEYKTIKRYLKKRKKIKISSNFVLRTYPKFKKIYDLVKKNKIGKIYHIEGEYNYGRIHKITKGWRGKIPFYSVTQGGGIHIIDLFMWILDSKVVNVVAVGNNLMTNNTSFRHQDTVTALLKFSNGVTAKLTSNYSCVLPHHHSMSVFGSAGTLVASRENLLFYNSRKKNHKAKKIKLNGKKQNKNKILESFISFLDNSFKKPIIKKEDVLNSMAVCLAVDKSLVSKKWEKVKY